MTDRPTTLSQLTDEITELCANIDVATGLGGFAALRLCARKCSSRRVGVGAHELAEVCKVVGSPQKKYRAVTARRN